MKNLPILGAIVPLFASLCSGAVSISVQVGALLDSSSSIVSDTSLWAIVYDADGNGVLPGGLTDGSSLTVGNSAQTLLDFGGKQISTNATIGLDRILWSGIVDSFNISGAPGVASHDFNNFTFASLGVDANGLFAIYWFPGLTSAANTLPTSNFEIGGIREETGGSGGDIGMVFPAADNTGSSLVAAFIDTGNAGTIPISRFVAITAIPEPSGLAVAALGAAGLLIRRRR